MNDQGRVWAAGRSSDPRLELAYRRFFTLKQLPWDVLGITLGLVLLAVNVLLALQGAAWGCRDGQLHPTSTCFVPQLGTAHGQDAAIATHAFCQSAEATPVTLYCEGPASGAVTPASEPGVVRPTADCQTTTSQPIGYPCNKPSLRRILFVLTNWQQLADGGVRVVPLLWNQGVLLQLALPGLKLLLCLAAYATLLCNKWKLHRRHNSSSNSAPDGARPTPCSSTSAAARSAPPPPHQQASQLELQLAAVPAWMPAARTAVVAALAPILVWMTVMRQVLQPAAQGVSSPQTPGRHWAGPGAHPALLLAMHSVISMLPPSFHLPVALFNWAMLASNSCAAAVCSSSDAAVPLITALGTFVIMVLATTVLVSWKDARLRQDFAAAWAALEQQHAHGGADGKAALLLSSSIQEHAAKAAASQGAAASAAPAAALAAAEARSCAGDAQAQGKSSSKGKSPAAQALELGQTPAAAAPQVQLQDVPQKQVVQQQQQQQQQPGQSMCSLYTSVLPRKLVTVSIKVPMPAGASYETAAEPILLDSMAAVDAAAACTGRTAAIMQAAAFPGCVHVLMDVMLLPGADPGAEAGSAEDGERQQQQQQQEEERAFCETLAKAMAGPVAARAPQAPLVSVAPEPPASLADPRWQQLPWLALPNPLCLPTTGHATRNSTVRVGLLPSSAAQLPGQPRAVVTGHVVTGAGVESVCEVVEQRHVWAPAAAEGRRLVSICGLPKAGSLAVLCMHLLPEQGAVAEGSAAVHPLASLPLLCLPPAAAEEALKLFARMVGDLVGQHLGPAAPDEAAVARQAYWRHYVPFIFCWRSLLLLADSAKDDGASPSGTPQVASQQRQLASEPGSVTADKPALLADAQDLLAFLAAQRMRACLVLAKGLLGRMAWVVDAVPLRQPQLLQECGQASARAAGAAGSSHGGDVAAVQAEAGQPSPEGSNVIRPAEHGSSAGQSKTDGTPAGIGKGSCAGLGAAAGASGQPSGSEFNTAQEALPSSKVGSKGGHKAGSAAAEHLDVPAQPCWRHLLRGFPQPATEEAYLAFRNRRCLAHVDGPAAAVCCVLFAISIATGGSTLARSAFNGLSAVSILFNLPWLAMLLHRPWYLQHREALLLLLGGTARVVFAVGHGLGTMLSGSNTCGSAINCLGMVAASTALFSPVVQQVRFLPALPVTLLSGLGTCMHAACMLPTWQAAALALGSAASGLAITAAADWHARVQFVQAQQ